MELKQISKEKIRKEYEKPRVELLEIDTEDIILTSGEYDGDDDLMLDI